MNSQVDVVIVNWNSGVQLKECIASLEKYASKDIASVVVVDNGSVDGSIEKLKDFHRLNVDIIEAGSNLGFGKACNIGAAKGNSPYILFLNPDAAVYEATIVETTNYMARSENQRVGVCGVQLKDDDNNVSRSCTRLPTVNSFLAHAIGLDRFLPKLGHFMGEWDHESSRSVDHVIGAFYFIRRNLFEELQGFDERFFVYLEDLDLSNRVKAKDWSIKFLSNVQAFHKGGGTSDQVKAYRLFYSLRSRLIYSYKHFSFVGATLVFLATLLIEPVCRVIQSILRGSLSSVKETIIAYKYLFTWLPSWIFKRNT
ncbi:glycosyl transferase [Pseudomonas lundensis]|uniref:Glycosyl transferase n=1 Tax=Pseudomonas lundensis TaxID=86185 RepID=A0A266ND63_9PSED|nr:glycosyltransferase family 2 protein [Pseudomonas lundensis]OZY60350.1 glycosyl transferase [Pseudomonas lundensis]